MAIVEEATFDRGQASHWITLFDMNSKYADVVSTQETVDFIATLDDDLFLADLPALADTTDAAV